MILPILYDHYKSKQMLFFAYFMSLTGPQPEKKLMTEAISPWLSSPPAIGEIGGKGAERTS